MNNRNIYRYRREDLYTAFVFYPGEARLQVAKYHKIAADRPATLTTFKNFVKKNFPGARYINLYGGVTGDFIRREYL